MPTIRCFSLFLTALHLFSCAANDVSLTDYVNEPTPPGEVLSVKESKHKVGSLHRVKFASLSWQEGDVSPSKWQHELNILVPTTKASDTAFLYISNGTTGDASGYKIDPLIEKIATENSVVGIEMRHVPNQGLRFFDEPNARAEDDLVAYSWKQFLKTGNRRWLAHFPMVKSVRKVMDYVSKAHPTVKRFIVAGQSKRGWTAWLVAATDTRVRAVVPMVIDLVNIKASMRHHKATYNGWSFPLKPYEQHGIAAIFDKPEFDPIAAELDPIQYKDKLTMPKLIVNAANDQFFLPDSSQFYFDQLKGEKFLSYLPNQGHRIARESFDDTVSTFVGAVTTQQSLPKISWGHKNGRLEITTDQKPRAASLWIAENSAARDFRQAKQYAQYKRTTIRQSRRGKYIVTVRSPESGWKAYFVQLQYTVGGKPLNVTTPVYIKGTTESVPSRNLDI